MTATSAFYRCYWFDPDRSLYLSSRITDGNFVFIIELLALQFITGNDINILGLLSNSDGLFEFSGIVINLNIL